MNNLVVQENAPVVGKKITVAPLYSVITGDLITPFPKTTDEIRALHSRFLAITSPLLWSFLD